MGPLTIKAFGVLAEKLPEAEFRFPYYKNTDELRAALYKSYPYLESLDFTLAVNKQIVQENTLLKDEEEIALLPPFSGG